MIQTNKSLCFHGCQSVQCPMMTQLNEWPALGVACRSTNKHTNEGLIWRHGHVTHFRMKVHSAVFTLVHWLLQRLPINSNIQNLTALPQSTLFYTLTITISFISLWSYFLNDCNSCSSLANVSFRLWPTAAAVAAGGQTYCCLSIGWCSLGLCYVNARSLCLACPTRCRCVATDQGQVSFNPRCFTFQATYTGVIQTSYWTCFFVHRNHSPC